MPYLAEQRKAEIDGGLLPTTQGDLTYLVTKAMLADPEEATLEEALQAAVEAYIKRRAQEANFGLMCDIIGAMECARREFQRRRKPGPSAEDLKVLSELEWFMDDFYTNVVAPYEDTKIEQNGDVYPDA